MSLPNAIASMLELSFALMRRRQERGGGGDDGGLKKCNGVFFLLLHIGRLPPRRPEALGIQSKKALCRNF